MFFNQATGERTVVNPMLLSLASGVESGATPEPTMRFTDEMATQFLQGFANGLAEAGYKPDELKSQACELNAVKYHLEDMRKLVFVDKK
jgi:hypothetical protein